MSLSSQFSVREIRDILIAWLVLSFAWGLSFVLGAFSGANVAYTSENLVAILIATVTGFILHEMGHKFVAVRYGYLAQFRLWTWGLALALITGLASSTGGFPILFGAPGAVYIAPAAAGYYGYGYYSTEYRNKNPEAENLRISIAGPGLNLLFAAIFLLIFLFAADPFLVLIGAYGFGLNAGLGAFNMLPIPPLDGYKIFRSNKFVWLGVGIPLWISALFLLGIIPL
jgi:Zn-dependent protease